MHTLRRSDTSRVNSRTHQLRGTIRSFIRSSLVIAIMMLITHVHTALSSKRWLRSMICCNNPKQLLVLLYMFKKVNHIRFLYVSKLAVTLYIISTQGGVEGVVVREASALGGSLGSLSFHKSSRLTQKNFFSTGRVGCVRKKTREAGQGKRCHGDDGNHSLLECHRWMGSFGATSEGLSLVMSRLCFSDTDSGVCRKRGSFKTGTTEPRWVTSPRWLPTQRSTLATGTRWRSIWDRSTRTPRRGPSIRPSMRFTTVTLTRLNETSSGTWEYLLLVDRQISQTFDWLVNRARDLISNELGALVGESYSRAYNLTVMVQQLTELEVRLDLLHYISLHKLIRSMMNRKWSSTNKQRTIRIGETLSVVCGKNDSMVVR